MKDTDCFTHVLSLALQTSHWQSTVYHHINLHYIVVKMPMFRKVTKYRLNYRK